LPDRPATPTGISPQIEHRIFSFVSLNWRGKPLESLEVVVNLIASTKTNTGLKVYAQLDEGSYERGIEITDDQLAAGTSPATPSTATGTTPSPLHSLRREL